MKSPHKEEVKDALAAIFVAVFLAICAGLVWCV
jgi:hypothetical protein